MKITKSYLRSLIKETLQQGSTVDVLATLQKNLPIVAKSKLLVPSVASKAAEMLEDLKSYQRITDRGENLSQKEVSGATRYSLYGILKNIQDLHSTASKDPGMNELAIAYNELLKVYKLLPTPR